MPDDVLDPTPAAAPPPPKPAPPTLKTSSDYGVEAARLQNEAQRLRTDVASRFAADATRVGTARDDVARRQFQAKQGAAAADQQVAREQKAADKVRQEIEQFEKSAAKAGKEGNFEKETEDLEFVVGKRAILATHEARLEAASKEATRLRTEEADLGKKTAELDADLNTIKSRSHQAELAIDEMEEKSDHYATAAGHANEAEQRAEEAAQLRADGKEAEALTAEEAGIKARRAVHKSRTAAEKVVVDEKALVPYTDPNWVDETAIEITTPPVGQTTGEPPLDDDVLNVGAAGGDAPVEPSETATDTTADATDMANATVGESGLEPASVLDAQAPVADVAAVELPDAAIEPVESVADAGIDTGEIELPPEEPAVDDGLL